MLEEPNWSAAPDLPAVLAWLRKLNIDPSEPASEPANAYAVAQLHAALVRVIEVLIANERPSIKEVLAAVQREWYQRERRHPETGWRQLNRSI